MKVGRWSTTAGNNNNTPPDGWPEGQAPSTVNDCAREMMAAIRVAFQDLAYVDQDLTPTFATSSSFTVPGNQTSAIHAGRRLKLFDATAGVATTIYATVATASFTAVTTIHISADAGQLTSSLSSFAISIIPRNNSPLPNLADFDRLSASAIETSSLSVSGDTTVLGNLTVSGQAHIGQLSVGGAAAFGATLTVSGQAAVLGNAFVGGNLTVSGQLHVAAMSLGGALALGSTLTVSGAAAFLGTLSIGGAATLGTTLTASGAATLHSTLSVSGATALKTTLTVSGIASFLTGARIAGGILSVESGVVAFPASPTVNANVNALDNYEEGTWTPSLLISATSTGIVYATSGQLGTYQRVGNHVHYNVQITLSSKGALAGPVTIDGLPFAAINSAPANYLGICSVLSSTAAGQPILAMVNQGLTTLALIHHSGGTIVNLSAGNIFNGTVIRITGFYRCAT